MSVMDYQTEDGLLRILARQAFHALKPPNPTLHKLVEGDYRQVISKEPHANTSQDFSHAARARRVPLALILAQTYQIRLQ
ncbi:hypothetical protein PGT21_017537 [Puccinia graminis f. sp. tritici]|uniref:Uncharacterized protein n=1 Tax=Puccinia graminis f. sp. tritici TaxID=56615 RepID=A0A5B0RLK9_PUCGR|nr:hypothetical protein PGT21_017537 [Puccinia graminis f. sp. tritici]KAA1125935.1 hypothetical protein PGTUg99_022629 [Puccinia graminis f. sp. tritici]